AEMREVMARAGFEGTFEEFLAYLRSDPKFYAQTPRELLANAAYVAKKVDGQLKHVLGTLPRYRFTILPVADDIAPNYTAGRGGLDACWFNTYDLPSRPLYNLPALVLHECSPGHSLQAALALEAPERPAFRQSTYFSGYGEGWALYTEWLGTQMGIYETPYEEFGRLSFEMWRAARLVIDTGIHEYGWSRGQAIEYLASHAALSRPDIANEVDRYISWPGQALSYYIGYKTIRDLRAEAERELGADFDQKTFHDTILRLGSVTTPVLEEAIRGYSAEQKVAPGAGRGCDHAARTSERRRRVTAAARSAVSALGRSGSRVQRRGTGNDARKWNAHAQRVLDVAHAAAAFRQFLDEPLHHAVRQRARQASDAFGDADGEVAGVQGIVVGQGIADIVMDAGVVATVAARADAAVSVDRDVGCAGRAALLELFALFAQPVAGGAGAAAAEFHRFARDLAEFVAGTAGGGSGHRRASVDWRAWGAALVPVAGVEVGRAA